MLRVRAQDSSCFVALCNAVGGQDELIFDGHSVVIDDEGEVLARAPRLRGGAARRRHRPGRRRSAGGCATCAAARSAASAGPVAGRRRSRFAPPRRQADVRHGTLAAPLGDLEQMRLALELGLHDYVTKNGFGDVVIGLSGGIDSALTAALVRRGARAGPRARRLDAVALLVARRRGRTASASRRASGSTSARSRSSRSSTAFTAALAPSFDGPRARPDRGEPAGARPRHAADGALEQVRLARDRDRQQVRAVGRLLDAVRRPGRRVRADQGRLQDRRLPARAPPERARRAAS